MSVYFDAWQHNGGEHLVPTRAAESHWYPDMLRGPAIALALARGVEVAVADRTDVRISRFTVDMHSPVPKRPLSLRTRILREGRRLLLVEADLMAEESVFSRARALLLSAGEQTGKQNLQSWNNPEAPVPPCRLEIEQNKEGRQYWSEEAGWTGANGAHENGSRKAVWVVSKERVKGERLSPFQLISSAADLANQVVNTNSLGLAHINADVSISIARLPLDDEIGVASLTRVEAGSVVVGSALLYDRRGIIGTTTVTSLPAAGTALSFSS
jgi:acyl-coenzyme A thioesterase PaaI-like protein